MIKEVKIEDLIKGVYKNVPLASYTTFKIGGPSKYFFVAKTKEDLVKAIKAAKKFNLAFFVLGGGSNLLVSDKGFNGLTVKVENRKYEVKRRQIFAEAGALLIDLARIALQNNLTGLEWAMGIPGTLGGAVRGNAGAFGKSMQDVIKEVEVFDTEKGRIKTLKKENCQFSYRESIFKKKKNLIILSAKIGLKRGDKKEIEKRMKENLDYRRRTQPLNFLSAGSIFKNPCTRTGSAWSKPPVLSAGYLIEKCGLKGKKMGRAQISEKHANFIVNLGGAKARDVLRLINLIKKKVKAKYNIELKEEIEYLGFNFLKKIKFTKKLFL